MADGQSNWSEREKVLSSYHIEEMILLIRYQKMTGLIGLTLLLGREVSKGSRGILVMSKIKLLVCWIQAIYGLYAGYKQFMACMLDTSNLWLVCWIQAIYCLYAGYKQFMACMLDTSNLWLVCWIQAIYGLYAGYKQFMACMLDTSNLWLVCWLHEIYVCLFFFFNCN